MQNEAREPITMPEIPLPVATPIAVTVRTPVRVASVGHIKLSQPRAPPLEGALARIEETPVGVAGCREDAVERPPT